MKYQIVINKRVIKTLVKINEPDYSSIKTAIYKLGENPRPNGYIKLKGKNSYRIRVGDYRIIYDIFDTYLLIDVINIGHRKDVYD